MFGYGAARHLHWGVLYVAYGLVSVGLTGVATISMTYVVESYWGLDMQCLELVNGLKNVWAFGIVYATVPWIEREGYIRVRIPPFEPDHLAKMLTGPPADVWRAVGSVLRNHVVGTSVGNLGWKD
jgi:hypothetical protein